MTDITIEPNEQNVVVKPDTQNVSINQVTQSISIKPVQQSVIVKPVQQSVTISPTGLQGSAGVPEKFDTLSSSQAITIDDTNTIFTNTGASALVVVDLPVGAQGLKFTFIVTDTDGFSLVADGVEKLQIGGSARGTMTNTKIGGAVILYGLTGGGYIATSSQGTWRGS